MDKVEEKKLTEEEYLEVALAQLTQEQRDHLDRIVELRLREEESYDVKYEIALAQILYEARPHVHEHADIEGIITRAYNEAREREARERWAGNIQAVRKAHTQKAPHVQDKITPVEMHPGVPSRPPQNSHDAHLQELVSAAREELDHKDKDPIEP